MGHVAVEKTGAEEKGAEKTGAEEKGAEEKGARWTRKGGCEGRAVEWDLSPPYLLRGTSPEPANAECMRSARGRNTEHGWNDGRGYIHEY